MPMAPTALAPAPAPPKLPPKLDYMRCNSSCSCWLMTFWAFCLALASMPYIDWEAGDVSTLSSVCYVSCSFFGRSTFVAFWATVYLIGTVAFLTTIVAFFYDAVALTTAVVLTLVTLTDCFVPFTPCCLFCISYSI